MSASARILGSVALAVWLPYCLTLWPLPPAQYATLRAGLEEAVAERQSKAPRLATESDADRKFLLETYERQDQVVRDFVAHGDQYTTYLWLGWAGSLVLVVFGLAGWTLVLLKGFRAWWMALLSTVGLVVSKVAVAASTYTHFLRAWAEGKSGFAFLPMSNVADTVYFDFLMPVVLILLTAIAALRYPRTRKRARGDDAL